jgi:hypothetical protein
VNSATSSGKHFSNEQNARIFDGICTLGGRGELNPFSLTQYLSDFIENSAAEVSALPFATAAGALSMAETLREKFKVRRGREIGGDLNEGKITWEEAETQLGAPRAGDNQFSVLTAGDILAMKLPDDDCILGDRVMSIGEPLVIAGPPGAGKSRLVLQLAACIITGRDFLDLVVKRRGCAA